MSHKVNDKIIDNIKDMECPKCGEIIEPQTPDEPWFEVYICDNCGWTLNQ